MKHGVAGQTPTIARTRDDLPEALGPMIPTALPACNVKLMSWATTLCVPGEATASASTVTL
jgi:hypothetical protein